MLLFFMTHSFSHLFCGDSCLPSCQNITISEQFFPQKGKRTKAQEISVSAKNRKTTLPHRKKYESADCFLIKLTQRFLFHRHPCSVYWTPRSSGLAIGMFGIGYSSIAGMR